MSEVSKFPESQRTFETRLLYIRDIFSDLYDPDEILAKCILHKLNRSYMKYVHEMTRDVETVVGNNVRPLKILSSLEKE